MKTAKSTPVQRWFGALAICLTLLVGAPSLLGQIVTNAPANDNFADAEILPPDPSGSVGGANVLATLEVGETNLLAGKPVGCSIWYSWTPPVAGPYTFSTRGSTFDTVLAVFTGDAVDALTLVSANDDYMSGRQSSVTFIAEEGVTYYFGVYGFDMRPWAPVDQGFVTLGWREGGLGGLSAGEFTFTSDIYNMSDTDNRGVSEGRMRYYTPHVVITRAGGAAGMVHVSYEITNDFYTNNLTLEIFGTNITRPDGSQEFYTNYVINRELQHMVFGNYEYLPTQTNAVFTNMIGGNLVDGVWPNIPAVVNSNGTWTVDNNGEITTYEQFYDRLRNVEEVVPSAIAADPLTGQFNYDYIPTSGEVTFSNYQMSAWVPLSFRARGRSFSTALINPLLKVNILGVQLDPLEEFNGLIPPSVTSTSSLVNLHNSQVLPGLGVTGTNMFSFERSTIRCTESVNGFGVARIHVFRISRDISAATSVPYRIDYLYPYANDHNYFSLGREFALQPGSEYATPDNPTRKYGPFADFTSVTGTVDFPANDVDAYIDIPINDDNLVEFDEDLLVQLYFPNPQPTDKWLGYVNTCVLTIHYDEQTAGSVDRTHNKDNDPETFPPYNAYPGANSTVYAVAVQSDNSTLIAGDFDSFNTVRRNRIARMRTDGQIDMNFNPGSGADLFINAMQLDSQERILIGGAFTSFNGANRRGIARLTNTGALDQSFDPGQGVDGIVYTLAQASDGAIYIAGSFTMVNATNRNGIARLLPDGGLDTTFNPAGVDGTIYSLAVDGNGKVYIGGQFTRFGSASRPCIARLNPDGSLDEGFNPRSGAQGPLPVIYKVAVAGDQVYIGGSFTAFYGVARNNLARLNTDGSVDLSFDPGDGTDDVVYSILPQADGRIMIGGSFTQYNQTRRVGLARLFSQGYLDTSFLDTAYNQYAGIPTQFHNQSVEPRNFVYSIALQSDDSVLIGGKFMFVGGGTARDDLRVRRNVARLIGGETTGPGNIELDSSVYSVDNVPNPAGNPLFIKMNRVNGHLGPASVRAEPMTLDPGPGSAQPDVDFSFDSGNYGNPTWITTYPYPTWQISDGTYGWNNGYGPTVDPGTSVNYPDNDLIITALDSTNRGDRAVNMWLHSPDSLFLLGGEYIPLGVALGRAHAEVQIRDDTRDYGTLSFATDSFQVNEGGTATIRVIRENGSDDRVTVRYATSDLGAKAGTNYVGVTNQLVFNSGSTSQTFTVRSLSRVNLEKNQTVALRLYEPTGGAILGVTNAVLTIVESAITGGYVQFSSMAYATNESSPFAKVTVQRLGSASGTLTATMFTTNINAVAGVNYISVVTNLTWNSGDSSAKVINIPILRDQVYQATNFLTVGLSITNARLNGTLSASHLGTAASVLTIINEDYRGILAFNQTDYLVNENGAEAIITVTRTGGTAESISVNYAAGNLTAFDGLDFESTSGTLIFAAGELSKSFKVKIIDNFVEDLPGRLVALTLSNPNPADILQASSSILEILDDESIGIPPGGTDVETDPSLSVAGNIYSIVRQPDGRYLLGGDFNRVNDFPRNRIARLNPDCSLDAKFSSDDATMGANDRVMAMLAQSDQRVLIGGEFTSVNGVARKYLARLMYNGAIDTSFNPGSGPESGVLALAETWVAGSRRLLVGGSFVTFNGLTRSYIVQLNEFGRVDSGFNPELAPNGPVHAIVVDNEGRILIGGDFTMVNGVTRHRVARLLPSGELDPAFDPGQGADQPVRALALQMDGRILVGGLFTQMGGVPAGYVARLLPSGQLDSSFNPGAGANDAVTTIVVQPDTRILLGGQFTMFNSVTRNRLTRLNADGSVDTMINFGMGANSFVAAIALEPDRRILFGGGFTEYDGRPADHIARIYGGTVAGPGALEFEAPEYFVGESDTNLVVTVRRRGGTSGTLDSANISVTVGSTSGSAQAGVNFMAINTNLVFAPGEILGRVTIPVMRDFVITPDLSFGLELSDLQPAVDGPSMGNQQGALVHVLNDDSGVNFSDVNYQRNETAPEKSATITIRRVGSTRGTASVDFLTTTNGTAVIGTNYWPTAQTVVFNPGESNALVQVPLIYDPASPGNLTVTMELTNAINALLFDPFSALLTIVDVDKMPGQLLFSQTNYITSEAQAAALITVLRTNGRAGTITANFATVPGAAQPGLKYVSTNGTLVFGENETIKRFEVGLIQNGLVDGHLAFGVALSGLTGGASLAGPNSALVTIMDDDVGVGFASPVFLATENSSIANLTLTRIGTNGVTSVQYYTTNGTALAGTNYVASSGTITFTNGESLKLFSVSVLHDPRVSGDRSFNVVLHNPSAPAQLFSPSAATVVILDSDPGVSFTNSVFGVRKSDTNVLISVLRTNANTGDITVRYATTNLTAIAGVDYAPVGGQLTFSNGVALQTFTVPIINNRLLQDEVEFGVRLFSPSPGTQLLEPSFARVVITNDISGFTLSAPGYSVAENGVSALITVLRTGFLDSTVAVDYTTQDGSGIAGVNYLETAGTFIFTNGETVKTFSVPILDNSVLEGDKTVLVSLRNPMGNSLLVDPSAAIINIVENDGSLIDPAGASMAADGTNVNGVIDPGETVTLWLGLRNSSGTNTVNLMASLLETNGVVPVPVSPSAPKSYGVLVTNGPARFQTFTFRNTATNGQAITPVLRLVDGAFVSFATFPPFTVGRTVTTYSNNTQITINDKTNATPYPSTIAVSGLPGLVTKATVTITNLSHTAPRDVSVLLVSPGGQKTYLMAKAGGTTGVKRATLTFDDAAPGSLNSTNLTSGVYKPTSFALAPPPFPQPAPPPAYATNLAVFNGSNPNGVWSLFVYDDTQLDVGAITNGWILNLTTSGPIPDAADVGLTMVASTNMVVATSNIIYTLTVTNHGPNIATSVMVTNVLPQGGTLVAAKSSVTKGAFSVIDGNVIWNIGQLTNNVTFGTNNAPGERASATLEVTLSTVGPILNAAQLRAFTADGNAANNYAEAAGLVITPRADLAVSLLAEPSPLTLGETITYYIQVVNLGPGSAADLTVSQELSPGVIPLSATPAGYIIYTNAGVPTVTYTNLGLLGSGGVMDLTVTARPTVPEIITGIARANSSVLDPLKGNNTATAKTVVESLGLGFRVIGNSLVLSWSATANCVLEVADSLAPGALWVEVSSNSIQQIGETRAYAVNTTSAVSQYFRLRIKP